MLTICTGKNCPLKNKCARNASGKYKERLQYGLEYFTYSGQFECSNMISKKSLEDKPIYFERSVR